MLDVGLAVDCDGDSAVDCSLFDGGAVSCDGEPVVTEPIGDARPGVGVEVGKGVEGVEGVEGLEAAAVVTGTTALVCETVFMA